jgi:hypothetical protein
MTTAQEGHLERIKLEFAALVDSKYRAGAAAHGGELLDAPAVRLLDYAIEEAIDQVTYLLSLREKLLGGRES